MFVFQVMETYPHNRIYSVTGTGKLMGGASDLFALQPYFKGPMTLNLGNRVKLNEFAEHLTLDKLSGDVASVNLKKGGKSDFTIHFTGHNLAFSTDAGALAPGIAKANNLEEGYVKITADEKNKQTEITVYNKKMEEIVSIRSDSYTEKTVGFVLGLEDAKIVSMPFSAKTPIDVRTTGSLETANRRVSDLESLKNGPDIYYVEDGLSGKMTKLDLSTAKLIQSNWEYSGSTKIDFGFEIKGENGRIYTLPSSVMIDFSANLDISKKVISLRGAGEIVGVKVDKIAIDPHTQEIKYYLEGGKTFVRDRGSKNGYREINEG